MDKKTALLILVENSLVLTEELKEKIRLSVDNMPIEQIDKLGRALSEEQDYLKENKNKILARLEALVE